MCTLTFTDRVSADAGIRADRFGLSYRLFFNRDELHSRGPEIPPSEARSESGVRYIAPTDSDAGGTWITANEFGVTVALLNGYVASKDPAPTQFTSRGTLVRSLADSKSVRHLWKKLGPAQLRAFRPAVVVAVAPGDWPMLVRWDGREVVTDVRADRRLPIASSSFEQSAVQRFRRDLYRDCVGDPKSRAHAPSPEALMRFQSYVGPDGPSALTPSMSRTDAATRSHCAIEVDPGLVRFKYAANPPHEAAPDHVVTLRTSA